MADAIVGSVGVQLVPSAKGFVEKTKGLLSGIKAEIGLDLKTGAFDAAIEKTRQSQEKNPITVPVKPVKLDEFSAKIKSQAAAVSKSASVDIPLTADGERMRREILAQVETINKLTKVEVPVDLEDAAKLRVRMAVELDILDAMAKAAHPEVTVGVDVDKSQVAEVSALSGFLNQSRGGMSGLVTAALALGPALVPVTAAVVGLAGALAAPLAAVGAGLTVFGFLSGFAVVQTIKEYKEIEKLRTKLAGLTKGTQAYADTQSQLKNHLEALTPAQKRFKNSLDDLKVSFKTLVNTKGSALLDPLSGLLRIGAKLIPVLSPIIDTVSRVFTDLEKRMGAAVTGPGFKAFVDAFAVKLGPILFQFADIAKNVFTGLFGLFGAFAANSKGLLDGIDNLTAKFAAFGAAAASNKGFQNFLAYIREVGPQVAATIGSLVKAIVRIGIALAPIGGLVLGGIKILADTLNGLPIGVVSYLAGLLITLAVGFKIASIAAGIFNLVLDANPISLIIIAIAALVVGLITAYKSSATFRRIVQGAFHAVVAAGKFMWGALRGYFRLVAAVWLTVAGVIIHGAAKAFGWIPGIGPRIKALAGKFDQFRNNVNRALGGIHDKTVRVHADTQAASAALAGIRAQLSAIDGAHAAATVGITTTHTKGHAQGGTMRAGEVSGINELGPELWIPATNGRVLSHQDSMKAAAQAMGGSGGGTAVFHIYDSDRRLIGTMRGVADGSVRAHAGVDSERLRSKRGARR